MSDRASITELREVFAFEMAYSRCVQGDKKDPAIPSNLTREQFAALWRDEEARRKEAYEAADDLLIGLSESGIKVTAKSTRQVQKALLDIMTIPPRTAYELGSAPSFDQSGSE